MRPARLTEGRAEVVRGGGAAAAASRPPPRRPRRAGRRARSSWWCGARRSGAADLRGRDELAAADVVVIDRLVAPEIVALTRPDARVVYVGRHPARTAPTRPRSSHCWSGRRRPGTGSCGSRAAIPTCSAGAARKQLPAPRPGCPAQWFRVSPRRRGAGGRGCAGDPPRAQPGGDRGQRAPRARSPGLGRGLGGAGRKRRVPGRPHGGPPP